MGACCSNGNRKSGKKIKKSLRKMNYHSKKSSRKMCYSSEKSFEKVLPIILYDYIIRMKGLFYIHN